MAKRWRNVVILAAIESVAGTEQAISAATDGIMAENAQPGFGDSTQQTNEHTGSLDGSDDVPIGGPFTFTFSTYVKGSGTPGTAPVIGKLLRACSWTQTDTDVAIPTEAGGTIAGTSSGDLIAPTPFAGADDDYKGMPILLSNVPSNPTFAMVKSFVDASNVLAVSETFSPAVGPTTAIQIPINTMYKPHSDTPSSLTFHVYVDGIKHVVIGARGNFTLTMVSGRTMMFNWTFTGLLADGARTDESNPTPTYPDAAVPKLTWRNDNYNGSFTVDGVRIGISQLTFENGNAVSADPDPNKPTGFDIGDITGRTMVATIDPLLASIATRDTLTKLQDGTKIAVAAFARRSAGNSFGILLPDAQVLSAPYGNRDGRATEQIRLKCTGINAGAYLAFW